MSLDVENVFGKDGILAGRYPNYQQRPGQVAMAKEVEAAIAEQNHTVVEGGCGSGKSLSYLVPTILHCAKHKKRAVVCTANIALQEQIYNKDLPQLYEILPVTFQFAMAKGRNNYFCLRARESLREAYAQGDLFGKAQSPQNVSVEDCFRFMPEGLVDLCKWSQVTETGDRSELKHEPNPEHWSQVSSTADDCLGESCPHRVDCFAEKRKAGLHDVQIIVTNYHLLMAAVSVRKEAGKDIVLPEFDILICDEAHKMADVARSFFGWNISMSRINRIRTYLQKRLRQALSSLNASQAGRAEKLISELDEIIPVFENGIRKIYGEHRDAFRLKVPKTVLSLVLAERLRDANSIFKDIGRQLNAEAKAECTKYAQRASLLADELLEAHRLDDSKGVYFIERFGKSEGVRLCKRVRDVSGLLRADVYNHTETTIATSATMAIRGNCKYIKHELGLGGARELVVGSPFDFQKQGLLITSGAAPDPQDRDTYPDKVKHVFRAIVDQANGRTMGLFTSYRVMRSVAEFLRGLEFPYTLLVQGEQPRMELVRRFKEDVSSVLIGTESFWAGVDVPGEALSCLVIDKIPFPTPGDPVLDAIQEACGDESFFRVSIPRAVLQLRQGAGRLIRTENDKGVLVILDRRLVTKGYGGVFLQSLPPMRRATSMKNGEIRDWLA